jgi:hypothetical protein
MKTTEEILSLYKQRVNYYTGMHTKMRLIQSIYNGTAQIPLADMEQSSMPSTPNLMAAGIDQMAGRITSVIPSVQFSSIKPGVRRYDRNARNASRVVTGWWQGDRMPLKMKQRGRHMIAYGMSPVIVRWNFKTSCPSWHVRHPLETFPSTDIIPGTVTPTDCIFAYRRSVGWLRQNGYGQQVFQLTNRMDSSNDASVLMIEYVDQEMTHLMVAGYQSAESYASMIEVDNSMGGFKGVTLEMYPNQVDSCPVVVPMRLTLDTASGQFDNMVGMYYQQAKLMALEVMAVEKGIFPDTYLVSRAGEVGRFLDGPHDGRTGMVNIISGGDIKEIQSSPGYLTNPTIDRLERNQRVTSGIPAEFGGESSSGIRTGRRGDAVLSAVIDYPVAEAQENFAYSLEEENLIAISLAKTYDGNNERTIFVGTGNASRPVTYIANETFENSKHVVSYPATGSDLNSLIVGIGQRVGLGIMSKKSASILDPYIDNPEVEHDQIIAEGLEQALVSGIQQQAASGQIPPLVLAKVMRLVSEDRMELAEALNKVTQDAMDEQAKNQPAPEEPATPDQAMAGSAVQAMAGGQGGQAAVSGPNSSQQNLSSLLTTLRRPQKAGV